MRFSTMSLVAGLILAIAVPAAAQIASTRVPVQRSGNVYHVAVCGPVPRGFARCFSHVVTDRTGTPLVNRFQANRVERHAMSAVVPVGYGPMSLISAYNPGVLAHYPTAVGSSATMVAVVDAFGYADAESDLGVYRSAFGLPPCTTANGCFIKYNQSGQASNYPAPNLSWQEETALDLDMVSAMCPHCKIMLVQANTNGNVNLGTAVNTAVAMGAQVVSNSYGSAELGPAGDDAAAYNHPGVAITVSTGDSGYGVQAPAVLPYVTAVGGTTLTQASNARGWSESAWSLGGSGCSAYYAKPNWQASITLCTKRMVADVSAVADPVTGVAIYGPVKAIGNPRWQVIGGTSASAPIVAGIYGANGHAPYSLGSVYGSTVVLNDVTIGSNGSCGGTYFCTAGVGYDGPTGRGTPTSEHGF